MKTIKVAFYKNSKTLFGKLIRFKQYYLARLPYKYARCSHVELVFENWLWWSSSEVDGGVRFKDITDNKGNWDYIEIKVSEKEYKTVYDFCVSQVGNRYNWVWIFFAQTLNMNITREGDYFCSHACTRALQEIKMLCGVDAIFVNPGRMYQLLDPS